MYKLVTLSLSAQYLKDPDITIPFAFLLGKVIPEKVKFVVVVVVVVVGDYTPLSSSGVKSTGGKYPITCNTSISSSPSLPCCSQSTST